ncbi:putative amidophosphoribosyltransferase [Mycolicibacterium sp. BK556]|uniref:ComF family protein n=1 Tax=unclassified Mycolicibacterium TaxID=2636767 RepID=UPI001619E855|nr:MULTISPECIES: ComF family protein [unclassified Mycolicibacterium]MBB3602534.1 putative amidophosphoribosyltransferase [Mycolicibacterium sp. BK556]MBB3632286.1 putative amidophosphoribosyltransferase [Mycolicibacterium sp. BK607]
MLDLVLPLECGGCGTPSTKWCDACATTLNVHTDEPHLVTPRIDPGVPVFALGRYAGPRRQAIVALKEHGRRDLVAPLARALALGIHQLLGWGILDTPFVIVPAPTRVLAARRRGGDPVTRIAQKAAQNHPDITVTQAVRTRAWVRDSVGLTSADRERNLAGRIKIAKPIAGEVLLVDDIVTTGATAREAVRVLHETGAKVRALLTLAHA